MNQNTDHLNAHLTERIETAKNCAKKMGHTFVAATFKTIISKELVKISVPSTGAKYMEPVSEHNLLVFEDENLSSIVPVYIKGHYTHGDFPANNILGKLRPRVVRHFYVLAGYYGATIAAEVTIKEKTDLITGEKMVIIDIQQEVPNTDEGIQVLHTLRLGVPSTGASDEALIPGSELCVKIEAIRPQTIGAKPKMEHVPDSGADHSSQIQFTKTESVAVTAE